MSNIEQRILEMKFNNGQFENALKTSLGSLDRLKQSLNFSGAGKALTGLSAAAKSVNMEALASGVEAVRVKFGALDAMAMTALTNITNRAMTAGSQLAQSFTTAPIGQGFGEYETKIGSIQTMLANTAKYGTTLGEVKDSLQKLNEYSDKTIYNFGDMTKNIGLFTNAGIRIKDATEMIQGFSNAAAASGTTSQGAAGAAYQLSQALSAGTIRLMDWRSLTNVGMGNKNMQSGIIEIARAMGTLDKAGLSASEVTKDFTGTLEKGWLSADVMSNYLKIMTWDAETMTEAEKKAYDQKLKSLGLSDKQIAAFKKEAQMASDAATKVRTLTALIGTIQESIGSGWATTFELLLGDFDEATVLFTNIKDALDPIITSQADSRNNLIKEWIKLGGRSAIIEGFTNVWKVFAAVATAAKDAFKEVFPPKAINGLKESVDGIRAFIAGIRLSEDQVKAIRGGFVVFFSIIKVGVTILKMGVGVVILLASVIRNVLGAALAIGQKAFDLLGVALNGLMAGFGYSFIGFDALGGYIMKLFDDLSKLNFGAIQPLIDIWNKLSGVIGRFGADAGGALAGVFSFDNFKALGEGLLDIWNSLGQVIKSTIDLGGRTQSTFMGWFGDFFQGVADAVKWLKDFVVNGVKMVKDAIVGVNQGVSSGIDGVSGAEVLGAIGSGISLGVIIVFIKKIKKAFDPITTLFESVTGAWDQLTSTLKTMQKDVKANIIVKIAAAILILAIAMKVLSEVDPNRLVSASVGIATSVAALATGMLVMDKMNMDTKGIIKIGLAMILLATAIIILGKAVKIFGDMSWESLAKGLISITVTIGGLLIMVKAMSKNGDDIIKASIGMNLLAMAILSLAGAVAAFGYMPVEVLKQGGLAIGAILVGMMFFMGMVKEDSILKAGAALVLLSMAISGLVPPILALGMMDPKVLQQGAGSILLLVFALALAARVMENSAPGAAAIVAMALALTILLIPIRQIGEMDLAVLNQGLLYLGFALIGLVVAVKMMEGSEKGALVMLAIAASITILAFAIVTLGSAPIEVVAVGLGVLIGAILAFGIAAWVLSGAIPAIAALSGSLLAFGVAMVVISASFIVLSIGLTMLGPAAAIGAGGIVLLAMAIGSVADQIPAVGALALAFIGLAAGLLVAAVAVLIFGLGLDLIGIGLTMVGLAAAAGIVGLMATVEAVRGLIFDVPGMLAVGGALAALGGGMILVGLGGTAMAIAMVFLSVALVVMLGVAAAIVTVFPGVGTAFEQLGAKVPSLAVLAEAMINLGAASSNLSGAMIGSAGALTASADQLDRVSSSALQTTITISNMPAVIVRSMSGIASSMEAMASDINTTVVAIGISMVLLKSNLDKGGEDAGKAIDSMKTRIDSGTTGVKLAVLALMLGLVSTLNGSRSNVESSAVKIGEAVISGMVRGLSDSSRVRSAARSVALSALDAANNALGIASPSKAFHLVGSRSVDGLEGGFLDSKSGLFRTIGRMAEGLTEEFKLAYYEIGDSVSDLMNANPVIRPVIDLDDATRGAKALNGMLATSFDIENSRLVAAKVAGSVDYKDRASGTPTPAQPSQKTVSFVQNNYSPKALSRIDIYRNTKNQLSAATGGG